MTPEEAIKSTLEKFPLARRIPVTNVAYWNDGAFANRMNLDADTRAYGWKGETLKAIKHVLKIQKKI